MPLEAIMLGAGNRGFDVYGKFALEHSEELKFVAVADADPAKLTRFGNAHNIPLESRFSSWEDLIAPVGARRVSPLQNLAAFVCLPDALHETAAIKTLEAGFHLMLEKPVASTLEGTLRVASAVRDSEKVVMLGYVLRFTPFFQTIRQIVQSGQLGEVVTISWRENVSSLHMAHSFVRGNWGNTKRSSAMILAKCSHDLDLLSWLTGKSISSLSSFGNLQYFNLEHAPEGSPERCLDSCPVEDSCIYHAAKIYLTDNTEWPTSTISADLSLEARRRVLETTNYGRCVYRADNDVVDNQVVAFGFEGGGSGTLTMHGLSAQEGRTIRIDGTKASLRAVFNDGFYEIKLEPHGQDRGELIGMLESETAGGRHGGGDDGLTAAFVDAVQNNSREPISSYLTSHILAFAIEQARLENRVVNLADFKSKLEF
jgi:predicted dehydrogenase